MSGMWVGVGYGVSGLCQGCASKGSSIHRVCRRQKMC